MDDGFIRRTFPKLAVGFAILATGIPWGLPDAAVFVLPLVAMMLVFKFASQRSSDLQPWFAFVAGLIADILTAGPFGFWALVYLLAYCFGRAAQPYAPGLGPIGLWLAFVVSASAIAGLGWSVASLYFMRMLDPLPMALGLGAVVALFPFASWALERLSLSGRAAGAFSFRR